MNQILNTEYNHYVYNNIPIEKRKKRKRYFFILCFSISICIMILFYLIYSFFYRMHENTKTNTLRNKYKISTLYPLNNNYSVLKLSNDISIIGLIEIPKLNVSYPILENSSEQLLKISVCRFSGPFPNRIGNLCIAGHNYKNNLMFSNLYKLNINDSIFITDLNNTKLEYMVYDKFKVKENNLECIKNTDNIQVTLITCNDINNSERIVIKTKVKG